MILPQNTISLLHTYQQHFFDLSCKIISCQDLYLAQENLPLREFTESDAKGMFIDADESNNDLKILFDYNNADEWKVLQEYCAYRQDNINHLLQYNQSVGISSMIPVKVDHCPHSHGICVQSIFGI